MCEDDSGTLFVLGGPSLSLNVLDGVSGRWSSTLFPDAFKDDEVCADDDGGMGCATNTGLHYSRDKGSNWFDYTTEDGLASDCAYSVFVEGSGASMRIWVGTALGASKGHF